MTVEALRRGEPDVLTTLLDRFGGEIQGVAYLILRDRAAAEDVLSETLLTALARGASLRDPDALRPWLLRIATNVALGQRRKGSRVIELHLVAEPTAPRPGLDPDDRAALWQGVSALAPKMRAAVVLRYYADLPVEEVATVLGVSPNTVKTQLKAALTHLRTTLSEPPALAEARHA
ncbi:MAG: RNA polymerase sigma factor [Candidatus Limnocylindrales bacterium]